MKKNNVVTQIVSITFVILLFVEFIMNGSYSRIGDLFNSVSAVHDEETYQQIDDIEKEFEGKGYGDFKRAVADVVVNEMTPFKAKYEEIIASGKVDEVLAEGAKKASAVADKVLARVQKAVGLYHK